MANFVYNEYKRANFQAEIDLLTDTIKVLLVMTNTTADIDDDANTLADFTNLDEMDGTGYARLTLSSKTISEDSTNDRAEFHAADSLFSALEAGTRDVQAAVVFKDNGTDATSVPICFFDSVGFPFTANGGDVTLEWSSEGVLQGR